MYYFEILGKKYPKEWLRVGDIVKDLEATGKFNHILFLFILGTNSIGKTYSIEDFFVEQIEHGVKCCIIRNSGLEAKKLVNGWNNLLCDKKRFPNLKHNYFCDINGVFRWAEGDFRNITEMRKKSVLMIPFIWANNGDGSIPQIDGVKYYHWDEILSGNKEIIGSCAHDFTIKQPKQFITTLLNRTNRNLTKPIFIFTANPHNLESDILSEFNQDFNQDALIRGEDIINIDFNSNFVSLVFPSDLTWDNEKLQEQHHRNTIIYGKETETYRYKPNHKKRIFTKKYIEENTNKKVMMGFTWRLNNFLMYKITNKQTTTNNVIPNYYLCKENEEENTKYYSLTLSDKDFNEDSIYIGNNIDVCKNIYFQILNPLFTKNKIGYDAPFTQKNIRELLDYISKFIDTIGSVEHEK